MSNLFNNDENNFDINELSEESEDNLQSQHNLDNTIKEITLVIEFPSNSLTPLEEQQTLNVNTQNVPLLKDSLKEKDNSKDSLEEFDLVNFDFSNQLIESIASLSLEGDTVGSLVLQHCSISSVDKAIVSFTYMTVLDLSHNSLTSIALLRDLVNLEELNISDNRIQAFPGLFSLSKLRQLNISYNHIRINKSLLNMLKYNKQITSFLAIGNPDYNFEQLKYDCLDNLQSIEQLDGQIIFKKKKNVKPKPGMKVTLANGKTAKIKGIKDYLELASANEKKITVEAVDRKENGLRTTQYYNFLAKTNGFV